MADPFVGEIRLFGGNFAPQGWAFCDGSVMPISQNTALFSLLGTTYGGDGQTTFALPDLRGRAAMHPSAGHPLGDAPGAEMVTLSADQLPVHSHRVRASSQVPSTDAPAGGVFAARGAFAAKPDPLPAMDAATITPSPGAAAHDNLQPFLTASYIIALQGIYPPRP